MAPTITTSWRDHPMNGSVVHMTVFFYLTHFKHDTRKKIYRQIGLV